MLSFPPLLRSSSPLPSSGALTCTRRRPDSTGDLWTRGTDVTTSGTWEGPHIGLTWYRCAEQRSREMATATRLVALLTGLALLSVAAAAGNLSLVVTTTGGTLQGTTLRSLLGNEFFAFKGIPYAEPPLAELRFQPPEPHSGWSGVRDASQFGQRCVQADMFTGEPAGGEDCLFLNVYTPRLPSEREDIRLPVMVWIHGGGFIMGDGDETLYGPQYLLDQQVVLVTLNYRLGPFGFFTTEDEAAPGNYGLRDQVLALRWVQDNIEAFGGDADEVTVFGESAGGASIGLLVLSPLAEGLFTRAISQSGASFSNFAASGSAQRKYAKRHAELLGCDTSSSTAIVECLREKPASEIMSALSQVDKPSIIPSFVIVYLPRVDAEAPAPFLPEDPHVALKNGRFNRVPWMNGMTRDESVGTVGMLPPKFLASPPDLKAWGNELLELGDATDDPAEIAGSIYRFYFGEDHSGEVDKQRLVDLLTDRTFAVSISKEIELASIHTPVYKYIMDHTGPGRLKLLDVFTSLLGLPRPAGEDLGVAHGDELMYLFLPSIGAPVELGSPEHKVVRFMVSVWTSFARHGYPSSDVVLMPRWPAYTTDRQQHMWLSTEPRLGQAAFSERLSFWNGLDIRENWRGPLDHDEGDI
ncbi:Carboxylesterase 4A [Amphibalanus amphitrite]|uniref:Carboxylic ester hydrolase n=1 Tax=Amphibalanus amphitrite TaxID=1232801 RepID=A0A6A4WTE5_AMPAM|nr:Carboxylesterase 4A [Amphibalanus amphitrite]